MTPTRVRLRWRKSETHGLLPDPEPRPDPVHALLHRRPPRRAAAHVRGPPAREAAGRRRRRSSRPKKATRSGSSTGRSSSRSGSTRSSAARPKTGRSSRPASRRCAPRVTRSNARVRDMDINGVWASVNFPSQITGFCGSVFSRCTDPDLGLAVTQAWNDWFFDEWYSPHPDRMVPMGITYLADRRTGRRGDPPQRGARLHRGDVARDAAPHRDGADLLRRGGIRSSPRAPRPTRSSASTSARRAWPTCRRARRWCRSARRCSASSR